MADNPYPQEQAAVLGEASATAVAGSGKTAVTQSYGEPDSENGHTMNLPTPSPEQAAVVRHLVAGSNVRAMAVAGAGKTTTILHAVQALQVKTLILTYSKALKADTREKVRLLGLEAYVAVHSFHSCAQWLYRRSCYDDVLLREALRSDDEPQQQGFQLVVVDEMQDLTPTLYVLVRKLLQHSAALNCQLLVVGDVDQSIYGFMDADSRYLTYATDPRMFPESSRQWVDAGMQQTWRVPVVNCAFVNRAMLLLDKLRGVEKPDAAMTRTVYWRGHVWRSGEYLSRQIRDVCQKYGCQNVAVLAPSLRGPNSPVRHVENILSNNTNIRIYVPSSDDERLDDRVVHGKLLFATYHQAKGLEKKAVFVFGFDASFFVYYDKTASRTRCTNAQYVAATRASHMTFYLHHCENEPLPYLPSVDVLRTLCTTYIDAEPDVRPNTSSPPQDIRTFTVSNLIRFLKTSVMESALTYIRTTEVHPGDHLTELPSTVTGEGGTAENVAAINGIALTAWHEYNQHGGRCSLLDALVNPKNAKKQPLLSKHKTKLRSYKRLKTLRLHHMAYIAAASDAVESGYVSRFNQLQDFGWLTVEAAEAVSETLELHLGEGAHQFEVTVARPATVGGHECHIHGRMDVVTDTTRWETKCRQGDFKVEDLMQLASYKWMNPTDRREYRLINGCTGKVLLLQSSNDELERLMHILIEARLSGDERIEDEDFINSLTDSLKV